MDTPNATGNDGGGVRQTHVPADAELADPSRLREVLDEVVVEDGAPQRKLHVPDHGGGDSLCKWLDSPDVKSIKCYPPGYIDWCLYCRLRAREEGVTDG